MLVSDFNFHLPEGLIAQEPLAARDAARMLRIQRTTGAWTDGQFRDFPSLLRPSDLVVFNNTRVFPARLYGRREGARGRIEVLLTRRLSSEPAQNIWQCLVRPGRKIGIGDHLFFDNPESDEEPQLQAEVIGRGEFGQRSLRFHPVADFFATLEKIGHVPLPPYISRPDSSRDRERYQTVYAGQPGSVAAPTAGLHFTREILERIRQRGVQTAEITLHVGLGTFQPIRVERVEDHQIHAESYSISAEASTVINGAISQCRRVIAVGTTTVRTLEHASRVGSGTILPGAATADLFIYSSPEQPFEFKVVSALLTNFHLPQSSLLMLVSAFGGKENILRAYAHAVSEKYRFYSYGDCMFIE